jgi:hypothetical protein
VNNKTIPSAVKWLRWIEPDISGFTMGGHGR